MSEHAARIRSYRDVFRLREGRRIHTLFGHEVPWPDGLPATPAVHAALVVLLMLIAQGLPGSGVLGEIPYQLRFIALPTFAFVFASATTPDGRSFYRYAWDTTTSMLGLQGTPSRRYRGRGWVGGELYVHPDLGWPQLESGTLRRVDGDPGARVAVRFTSPVRIRARGRRLMAQRDDHEQGGGQLLELAPGEALRVRA